MLLASYFLLRDLVSVVRGCSFRSWTYFLSHECSLLSFSDFPIANEAWYNYGTDFGTGVWGKYTDWNSVSTAFSNMHNQGVHVVRWWVFADGRYSPDFNADGTVSGLDSQVLPNIDQALQIASINHIYLLFTLMDNGMWNNASYSGPVQLGGHGALLTNTTV